MAPSPNTPIGISATDAARREVVDDQPRRQIDHDEVVQSDIRHVRQLQELMRAPGGREHFARFMVSGHWRRPAKSWSDQRLRWIEPYWKGPDVAAVIEKAYRLRPSSAEAAPPSPP